MKPRRHICFGSLFAGLGLLGANLLTGNDGALDGAPHRRAAAHPDLGAAAGFDLLQRLS